MWGGHLQIDLSDEYPRNKRRFIDWKEKQEKVVNYFNYKMGNSLFDRNVYLFGAHVNTQFLLAFRLRTDWVAGVIDNDSSKQGRRLYGTPFQVYSPEILKNQDAPVVILRSGTHNDEIKEGIKKVNALVEIWEE